MECDPVSTYLWLSLFFFFIGWAIAGIMKFRGDRVSRLVGLSLLFSASVFSITIVLIYSSNDILSVLSSYWFVFFLLFCFGVIFRFFPLWGKYLMLFFLFLFVFFLNTSFSQIFRAEFDTVFGSVVRTGRESLELNFRDPHLDVPIEKIFLDGKNDSYLKSVDFFVYNPSPFIFRKAGIYYMIALPSGYESAIRGDYQAVSGLSLSVFQVLANARLLEIGQERLEIPEGLLRVHFLRFNRQGIPEILRE